MIRKFNIDGRDIELDVPDDATDQEIDDIVNAEVGGSSQPEPTAQEPQSQTEYKKYGVAGALFPATTKATERGGGFLARTVAGMGDALTIPVRGASALGTGLGTIVGGGGVKAAAKEAIDDFSKNKSEEKGALGFVQDMAYDPTSSPLLLGAGNIAKVGKGAASIGKALVRTGAQGAATGAASSAYQQAEEGKINAGQTAGQAALGLGLGAGASGIGGLAKKGVGKLLSNSAIRNIDISLRPGQFGRKVGYDTENVVKHDLVGSPRETFEKATQKLDELQAQAQEIGQESDQVFDIEKLFDDYKKKLSAKDNPEGYQKQLQLLDDAKDAYISAFGKQVDAPTAMKVRTKIGEKTAFVGRSQGGMKVDPDADWKEQVYNGVYQDIKKELHEKLGGELQKINKAQSEIIPVKMVAERRMPIAESNQRIGLSDLLTTGIGQGALGGIAGAGVGAGTNENRVEGALKGLAVGATLAGARKGLGSPTATKAMYSLGKGLLKDKAAIPPPKRRGGTRRPVKFFK